MYQKEALYVNFHNTDSYCYHALQIGVGKVNAISGEPWSNKLSKSPQDYVVIPSQPWLDGINYGDGYVRQFIAMPLGEGYTIESQITGKEEVGGFQFMAFPQKVDKQSTPTFGSPTFQLHGHKLNDLSKNPAQLGYKEGSVMPVTASSCLSVFGVKLEMRNLGKEDTLHLVLRLRGGGPSKEGNESMGIAAGGKIAQKIYADGIGINTWNQEVRLRCFVHIVNSEQFKAITGKDPPKSPINQSSYIQHGIPWFEIYDEKKLAIGKSNVLSGVKSVKEIAQTKGNAIADPEDDTININNADIKDTDW